VSPKKVTNEAWNEDSDIESTVKDSRGGLSLYEPMHPPNPRLCHEFLVTFHEPFSASKIYFNEEEIFKTSPADSGSRSYECTCILLHNSLLLCRGLEPVQAYEIDAANLVEHTMACIPLDRHIQGIRFCETRLVLDTQTHLSSIDLLGTVSQSNRAADNQPRSRYISFAFSSRGTMFKKARNPGDMETWRTQINSRLPSANSTRPAIQDPLSGLIIDTILFPV
jgi:hypothetical protein